MQPSAIYSETFPLHFEHLDFQGLCRPAAFLNFAQKLATTHAEELRFLASGALREKSIFWMLARQRLFVRRAPKGGETLSGSTWTSSCQGVGWRRDFSFAVGEEIVAEVFSMWVMADMQTRRIVPPSQMRLKDVPFVPGAEYKLRPLAPAPAEGEPWQRTVGFSDLDRNGHLNNVRAAEVLCDGALLHRKKGWTVREFQINLLAETGPDETLSVYAAGDPLRVTAYAGGEARFTGEFLMAPLEA